jgi:hypothetical protein
VVASYHALQGVCSAYGSEFRCDPCRVNVRPAGQAVVASDGGVKDGVANTSVMGAALSIQW